MQPLLHVALLEPKIPQNSGNIGRLTLAMGARLHLVGALGFQTDAKALRRAGLDYWKHVDWALQTDLAALRAALPAGARTFAFTTRAERLYTDPDYRPGDCLLFGDEVHGLPQAVVEDPGVIPVRIPLRSPQVRSLNLANAAAIAVAEVVRQLGHPDATAPRPSLQGEPCTQS
jgi:tRNA (cytidine/uridine-2'-O-)-methyltransferase